MRAGPKLVLPAAAMLFDCDGVLVDSGADVDAAWTAWAREYRFDADHVLAIVPGRRTTDTVGAFFAAGPAFDAALARIDELELTGVRSATAMPGAVDLVHGMARDQWAVVTSGRRDVAQARLVAAGLWPAPLLVGAEDVRAGKPAPDGYALAARELGVEPAAAIVVEDTLAGVAAARAARVGHVVGVGDADFGNGVDVVVTDLRPLSWTGDGLRVDLPS